MLVRNLATIPLNLRKGGQKITLLPGAVTAVPEVLFTKDQIKAIYGSFVQVLNDNLAPLVDKEEQAPKEAVVIDDAPVAMETKAPEVKEEEAEPAVEEQAPDEAKAEPAAEEIEKALAEAKPAKKASAKSAKKQAKKSK